MPKRGGWWVKAAATSVTPTAARPPRCLHKTGQAQVRTHCVGGADSKNRISARSDRSKKSPRTDPRARRAKIVAVASVVPDHRSPTGTLLDRARRLTPDSRLKARQWRRKHSPQSRCGQLSMESHPLILRNTSSFSKQNPASPEIFLKIHGT